MLKYYAGNVYGATLGTVLLSFSEAPLFQAIPDRVDSDALHSGHFYRLGTVIETMDHNDNAL